MAQAAYPNKPITILVGFAPGGLIDVISRLVGQRLQEKLGQPVVIENRAGAAGNIAHRRVATGDADGYTILGGTTSMAINETVYAKRGYVADDFITVSIAASSPEMISAPVAGAKTLKEFIDSSRSTSAQFGTAGAGSASYITTQYFFQNLAKIPTTHIPFQGGAPAVAAALGNQIPLVATPPAAGAAAPVRANQLRGLAIAADKRMALLPDDADLFGKRLSWLHGVGLDRLLPAGQDAEGHCSQAEHGDPGNSERTGHHREAGGTGLRAAVSRSAGVRSDVPRRDRQVEDDDRGHRPRRSSNAVTKPIDHSLKEAAANVMRSRRLFLCRSVACERSGRRAFALLQESGLDLGKHEAFEQAARGAHDRDLRRRAIALGGNDIESCRMDAQTTASPAA